MSSDGFELLAIPLEAVIGFRNVLSKKSSSQTLKSSRSVSSPTLTKPTSPSSIEEIRYKFEEYLSSGELEEKSQINLQKLQLLDWFYDPRKKRSVTVKNQQELFTLCNSYLFDLIRQSDESGIMIQENQSVEYPFLSQLDMILSENEILLPIFADHQYSKSWFLKKQEELKAFKQQSDVHVSSVSTDNTIERLTAVDEQIVEQEEITEDFQLNILVGMIINQMKDMFSYFHKQNSKYCKKWLQDNLPTLPKHLFEDLKTKHERNQKFKDLLSYKEQDMVISTILDSDFEFIKHLSECTSDWKLFEKSKINSVHVFTSKENYTTVSGTKTMKYVYYHPYDIHKSSKGFLSFDFTEQDGMFTCGEFRDYKQLDINNSSRKYSSAVRSCTIDLGKFFTKRHNETVVTSKAKFIGDELVETIILYKSCNSDPTQKNKFLTVGGFIIQKDDVNRCRITDLKMFNMGGFLQSDFIVKFGIKMNLRQLEPILTQMMKEVEETNYVIDCEKKLIWRTFCEYCQEHYKIDANQLN